MTLYLIGLGLHDMCDITLRGLEAIRQADVIYLEQYTAVLHTNRADLEKFFKKKIILTNRFMVENGGDEIVNQAKEKNVAFLVVGDPFGATTHIDLFSRAKNANVKVEVVHNASILNAVGVVGLELYKYGRTTSLVFDDEGWLPSSPYEVILNNQRMNLHTLCLLDIKVAEPTKEDMRKGLTEPQPPRFMTVHQGIAILKKLEQKEKKKLITDDITLIGVARLGGINAKSPIIKSGTPDQLLTVDFGKPMHSIIIPAKKLHDIEAEMIASWQVN